MEEEKYMRRCIELAKNGLCNVAPNPMVGAVIVCDGRIIGEGYHVRCGEAHAEVNAIRSVKDESLLKRSTIYVSLEPCSHYGKTPPCADLIIEKQIPRIVIGCRDPFSKVAGRGIQKLQNADVEAWDISEEALAIARTNNEELESRVLFRQRDVLSDDWEKTPSFDVIVSNPPYVTEAEKDEMEANVLDWEPALALFVPDDDPLRFYHRIAALGRELLLPEGKLYFEINRAFGREIAYMLEMNQYRGVRVIKDIFGKDRIVTANR